MREERGSTAREKVALVSGAGGFMGSRMVELLKKKGWLVCATDIALPKEHLPWDFYQSADLIKSIQAQGLVWATVTRYGRLDAVFHIAGLFDYSAGKEELDRANVEATRNLFTALAGRGLDPRIIDWSAAGGYPFPTTPGPAMTEETTPEPQGNYLQSKYEAEQLALRLGDMYGFCVSALRPGGVYGPGARYGVGLTLILAGHGMMGPIAPDTGANRGSTVHVADVCGAALFLAEQPAEKVAGQVYNVADDSSYTLDEITRFIGQEVGFPFLPFPTSSLEMVQKMNQRLVKKAEKIGRVSLLHPEMSALLKYDSLLSTAKLQALGWRPNPSTRDAKEGLRQTIAWYKEKEWINSEDFKKKHARATATTLTGFCLLLGVLTFGYVSSTPQPNLWSQLLLFAAALLLAAVSWLGHRLVFVITGFNNNNLKLWTRPSR